MHEVGFEPTNSKRQDLKPCAFLWIHSFGATNAALSK